MSASLRLTPLDYRKAQGTPPVNGGTWAVYLDHWQRCALGYWREKQKLQDIDLFTLYSPIYRRSVVMYNCGQKECFLKLKPVVEWESRFCGAQRGRRPMDGMRNHAEGGNAPTTPKMQMGKVCCTCQPNICGTNEQRSFGCARQLRLVNGLCVGGG